MKNKTALAIIFITLFIDLLGFGMILPLLPIWAERFTDSKYAIIAIGSVYSLLQFIFAPVWGRLSDEYGRKPIILASLLGGGLSFLMMAFAPNLTWLYIARGLQGMFTAGGLAAAPALVADVTTPEERSKGMGLIGAAFGLGFVFGPFFGAELGSIRPSLPFFVAAGLCGLNFIWAFIKLPETYHTRAETAAAGTHFFDVKKLKQALNTPLLGFMIMLFFVFTLAFSNLESTFTLFLQDHFSLNEKETTVLAGRVLGFVGVMIVIIQGGLIGRLTKRFGERKLLVTGLFLVATGMMLYPFTPTLGWLMACSVLVSGGVGISGPSMQSLISKSATADTQGGVMGLSQGLSSLARVFGVQWGGIVFQKAGSDWPYFSGSIMLYVAFVAALVSLIIKKHHDISSQT